MFIVSKDLAEEKDLHKSHIWEEFDKKKEKFFCI